MPNVDSILEEIDRIDQKLADFDRALLPLDKRKELRSELKLLNIVIEDERKKEQTIDQRVHLKDLLTNRQNILQQLYDNDALSKQQAELLTKRAEKYKEYEFFIQQINQVEECNQYAIHCAASFSSALSFVVKGTLAVDFRSFSTIAQFESFKQSIGILEKSARYIQYIQNNAVKFADMKTAAENFVAMNLRELSTLSSLDSFQIYTCKKAGFSDEILLQLSSSEKIPSGITESLKHQSELFVDFLSEFLEVEPSIRWFIYFHEVYQNVILQLSDNWSGRYPQFENTMSEEAAVEQYICLEFVTSSKECFQFACWLLNSNILTGDIRTVMQLIESDIAEAQKSREVSKFRETMLSKSPKAATSVTLQIIDAYSGIEFEKFIGTLFEFDGYKVRYTLASNDKGIDIIANRNGISIGIQCKCYSSTVGISAVQEVFSGKNFYSLDKALVVTNRSFTKAARSLAEATGVVLWDRGILEAKISLL